jgi:hypothetical protein
MNNRVQKSFAIPAALHFVNVATNWTLVGTSGIIHNAKAAADETQLYTIPINIPRTINVLGIKITKIEVPMRVAVADLEAAMDPTLYRVNMLAVAAANVDITATTITTTNDTFIAFDANDRLLTVTVTTPIDDLATQAKCSYSLNLTLNAAATTTIRVYDAIVYYEEIT